MLIADFNYLECLDGKECGIEGQRPIQSPCCQRDCHGEKGQEEGVELHYLKILVDIFWTYWWFENIPMNVCSMPPGHLVSGIWCLETEYRAPKSQTALRHAYEKVLAHRKNRRKTKSTAISMFVDILRQQCCLVSKTVLKLSGQRQDPHGFYQDRFKSLWPDPKVYQG